MTKFEYKTLPAPRRERRARGRKPGADAFADTIQSVLNDEAAAGWEFQRAESLPCDVKKGWFGGRFEVLHTVLIFRRAIPVAAPAAPAPPPLMAEPSRATTKRSEPAVARAPEQDFNVLD